MTDATRKALQQVDQILHEAHWDQPAALEGSPVPTVELARLRNAYSATLRHDDFDILMATLKNGLTVEQAGEKMGLSESEARKLLREAVHHLRDFVDVYEGNGIRSDDRVAMITAHSPQRMADDGNMSMRPPPVLGEGRAEQRAMTLAELIVGDHFIWSPTPGSPLPDSINVIVKIEWGEDGGGFATDLATRLDCVRPTRPHSHELAQWIPGATPVIKLNGRL